MTPACEQWASVLEAEMVGHDVPEEAREQAASHERACQACAGERAAWRRLAELPGREAAEGAFVDGVLRALDRPSSRGGAVVRARTWRVAGALAAAAAAALFVRSRRDAPAPQPALASVRLVEASGDVRVGALPASAGAEVRAASTISIGAGRACLAVDPGVRVCAGSRTEASVADVVLAHRRVDVRRGHVVVSLEPQPAGATFSVSTPAGTVTAVGTEFAVDVSADGAVARVLHGVVAVRADGREERLGAHEQLRLGARDRSAVTVVSAEDERSDRELLDGAPSPAPPPSAAPSASEAPATTDAVAAPSTSAPVPSPAELLRAARALRGERKLADAAQTYRKLQALHPGSVEAHASYVSLGELQLTGLSDPDGALRSFDTYLASPGALTEEARYGRIRALRRLGRRDDERRAIEAFLADYPSSAEGAELQEWLAK